MLLQAMADQFGVNLYDYADTAFNADLSPSSPTAAPSSSMQTGSTSRRSFTASDARRTGQGPSRTSGSTWPRCQDSRSSAVFVLQGGTQRNLAAVKAQVDYIAKRVPDAKIVVHPHTGEAGAIGAAMETLRVVKRRGHSTFIGMEQAIDLSYTTVNDESTVCHFCPNECSRTFIDTETPDGRTSRYISGFSCEKGTVESKEAWVLNRERGVIRKQYPNMVSTKPTRPSSPSTSLHRFLPLAVLGTPSRSSVGPSCASLGGHSSAASSGRTGTSATSRSVSRG